MKNNNLSLNSFLPALARLAHQIKPYTGVLFFVLLACIYGFILLQINTLSNAQVDSNAVSDQVKASPIPRIDGEAVKQLESLKDNSVNVQTLFDQGRTNPFQE